MARVSNVLGALVVLMAVGAAGISSAAAQHELPSVNESPWRIVLQSQIKTEQGCDLHEVLMYREIPIGGEIGIEGRVSCLDGRQFDFSRGPAHPKFRIELCAPAVC